MHTEPQHSYCQLEVWKKYFCKGFDIDIQIFQLIILWYHNPSAIDFSITISFFVKECLTP